jgi:hypothetical protein
MPGEVARDGKRQVRPPADGSVAIVTITLQGQLNEPDLASRLERADEDLRQVGGAVRLVVDALRMTGYDSGARERFVAWHRDRRPQLRRVAIVTDKPLWSMVVRAMALAAGVPMRPFATLDAALAWAREG